MRNLILGALSAGLLFAAAPATPAHADNFGISLHFGDGPNIYLARRPAMVLIPGTPVYYAQALDGYDMFECDGVWYVDRGGYWYSAPTYRGPFVAISYANVPSFVLDVPTAYATQPYRPGMWRRDADNYNRGGYGGYYGGYYNNSRYYNDRYNTHRWQQQQVPQDQSWQQQQRARQISQYQRERQQQSDQRENWNGQHGHGHRRSHDNSNDRPREHDRNQEH